MTPLCMFGILVSVSVSIAGRMKVIPQVFETGDLLNCICLHYFLVNNGGGGNQIACYLII